MGQPSDGQETPEKPVTDILSGFTPIEHDVKPRRNFRMPFSEAWSLPAVRLIAGIVIALLAFGFVYLKPAIEGKITGWTPSVGDCVTAAHSDAEVKDVKAVDCSDSRAARKVIGVFKYREMAEFEGPDNPCIDIADTVETIFYGQPHNGFILCLADN